MTSVPLQSAIRHETVKIVKKYALKKNMYDVTLIFKADYFHLLQQRLHHESRVSQEQVQNFLSSILLLSPVTFTQSRSGGCLLLQTGASVYSLYPDRQT